MRGAADRPHNLSKHAYRRFAWQDLDVSSSKAPLPYSSPTVRQRAATTLVLYFPMLLRFPWLTNFTLMQKAILCAQAHAKISNVSSDLLRIGQNELQCNLQQLKLVLSHNYREPSAFHVRSHHTCGTYMKASEQYLKEEPSPQNVGHSKV